ncbi:hypothetical protein [Rhodococcus sp. C3V]|uniref:hypothetical protein n=1 Tax=Rhodococcus sp. C3V TaxID=3034165 RepID=UPI0023E1408A|nr:hypothetical protein [Rhodococcus sp. C3V]MDF3316638.1 hypothetical protein [Rhodococcus sp. C3V]
MDCVAAPIRVAAFVHRSSPQVMHARRYLRWELVGGMSFVSLAGGSTITAA